MKGKTMFDAKNISRKLISWLDDYFQKNAAP
jgi:hypothetical protein